MSSPYDSLTIRKHLSCFLIERRTVIICLLAISIKMDSVLYTVKGLNIWLRTFFAALWLFFDILRSIGNVNDKRLREVQQDERDIIGKFVIVTGSNSGIGKQTARELAGRGAKVIMACRDPTRAEDARQDILKEFPNAQLELMKVDMSDLESIRSFVSEFKSRYNHLNVLINNAGVLSHAKVTTKDGFENHIGTNYLGSFLLTHLLLDSLLKADNARIVFLSSSTIAMEVLDVDNLMMTDQQLGIDTPYANSKLCLAMFSKELAKHLSGTNVTTYALCTGLVKTNLLREKQPLYLTVLAAIYDMIITSSLEEGTATVLHCALSKSLSRESGRFYRYLTEWDAADEIIERHSSEKLWALSKNLVGLKGFVNHFQKNSRGRA